jgi:two-component system nitrogen regulation response regulator GlnG
MVQRLAALYTENVITEAIVEAELAEPEVTEETTAQPVAEDTSLSAAVERHLGAYFSAHTDGLPPNGLYDRILREVERPLINICLAATRGNQIKAAELLGLNRNTLRKKIRSLDIQVIRGLK